MVLPLYINGTDGLREFNTARLERLSYYLRVAYANSINGFGSNARGAIRIGGSNTVIGSAVDTVSTQRTSAGSVGNNSGGETNADFPAAPGIGLTTDPTVTFRQNQSEPGFPSNVVLDNNSFLYINGTDGLRTANTEPHLYDDIVSHCVTQMRTGDEVGTYRIATSSPGAGWSSQGVWFRDDRFSSADINYNYYLRTSATVPGTDSRPVRWNGTDVQEVTGTYDHTHPLVTQVLLPALQRRIMDDLRYSVTLDTAQPVGSIARGDFFNTRQTGSTTTNFTTGPAGNARRYFRRSTPSGAPVEVSHYRLSLR